MQEKIFNYKEQTENSVFIMLKVVLSLFSNLQYATEMSKDSKLHNVHSDVTVLQARKIFNFQIIHALYMKTSFILMFLDNSST